MERDKRLDAEADMSVEACRAVFWVEVRCKEKGLPDCATWKNRKASFKIVISFISMVYCKISLKVI